MEQEAEERRNAEERRARIKDKIIRRGRSERGLSPGLIEVLRKIGAESEVQAAIDAGREEGIEPTEGEINRIKS